MKKIILFLFILFIHFSLKSQDYIGLNMSQIINIKGKNYELDKEHNIITYSIPSIVASQDGVEIFYFDDKNEVNGFVCAKDIYKLDLINLIKFYNSKYKSRYSGVNGEMQWVDIENNIEITLKTTEYTDNISFIFCKSFKVN